MTDILDVARAGEGIAGKMIPKRIVVHPPPYAAENIDGGIDWPVSRMKEGTLYIYEQGGVWTGLLKGTISGDGYLGFFSLQPDKILRIPKDEK